MLLTPPDVISQVLLAIPVWLLFELGLIMSRLVKTKTQASDDDNRFRAMTEQEMDQELDEIELLETQDNTAEKDGKD
jgi:sec-independent protein translocase protein TatC